MKKIISLVLTASIIFTFSSCGIKKQSQPAAKKEKVTTAVKETASSAVSASVTQTTKTVQTKTEAQTQMQTKTTAVSSTAASVVSEYTGRDIEQFSGKKLLAFTFDDGPYTPVTEYLLERLDKYNARVTFFVVGNRVDGNPGYRETLKKAYKMGNQIGSHSYSHSDISAMKPDKLKEDTEKSSLAVKKVIGIEPECVRPPYGSVNKDSMKILNKHVILWSIDSLDWKTRNAKSVHDTIMSNAFDGGIVLLHDLYQTSVEGALSAMNDLQKQGYAFVTVDELCRIRGVNMDCSTKYFQFKPEN